MFRQLLLQVVLIALNAFFAATEIALISINEKKVESLAEGGDKKAAKLLKVLEDPTKFLSAIQVGITLAGFLGSAFAADNFAERLTGFLVRSFHIASAYVNVIDTVSVIVITLILSYFTLVLGELVPKRIAMRHKESLARRVCGLMTVLSVALGPVIWFLTVSTNLVLRMFRINPNEKDESVSEEDIVIMLDAGADEGTLNQDDIEYIKNVFKLDRMTAEDVMTPRGALIAVPRDIPEAELISLIDEEGYSRIPVYEDSVDNIVGILHSRKFLIKRSEPDFRLEDALLTPEFVPSKVHLDSLFKEMQKNHTHMVIVVDEYGSIAGVVTMEDILEEIVGEIWDEQDEATESIVALSEDTYKVLTSISIDEFFTFFHLPTDEEIDSSTVNGWITEICGTIPETGYSFDYGNLSICVTEADEHLSREVEVKVLPPETEEEQKEEDEE